MSEQLQAVPPPPPWSAKPFMKKTIVKFGIIFILLSLLITYFFIQIFPILIVFWVIIAFLYFGYHYLSKRAFTYHITETSVRIEKSWVFGNFARELTFDQISDIHVNQGILARMFDCGSVVFVTKTGLEVGARVGGAGAMLRGGVFGGGGTMTPTVVKGRGNMLWDIPSPGKARELFMSKLTEWRTAYQQQKMAVSLETMAGRAQQTAASGSMAEELKKLKALYDSGAITKEEYEKAKKKSLG